MRQRRQAQILRIISDNDIKTQEQLTDALKKLGYDTTQATVSRDIKELGLIKTALRDGGYKYASPVSGGTAKSKHMAAFSDAVISIECAMHTVVIRTFAGMAQAVCASIDMHVGKKIMGSIAGDDTILVIMHNELEAADMCKDLKLFFKI